MVGGMITCNHANVLHGMIMCLSRKPQRAGRGWGPPGTHPGLTVSWYPGHAGGVRESRGRADPGHPLGGGESRGGATPGHAPPLTKLSQLDTGPTHTSKRINRMLRSLATERFVVLVWRSIPLKC